MRCVQFVRTKQGKCLCETSLISLIVKAVRTETCRHSRLLVAHNEKGLKIKMHKVAPALADAKFWVAARRGDTLAC